jgi:hypothetical protein
MRKLYTILFLLYFFISAYSQELPPAYHAYINRFPEGPPLNHWDSLSLMNIPEKTMPAYLRADPLPAIVDNSTRPYLRPVFMQVQPSCGQAAMIGYNFTYEIDYLRDQPAVFPQTQYPTHFAYNFQNGGDGWYGVSYFHSLEILRTCGTMNVYDYGDFFDDGKRWINGYNYYYNAMFNRIKGFYSIHTGTEEGILALKHWLYDHMGEGNAGGVASYYACSPWNTQFLNDTTPEGGKYVMTAFSPMATHAMTIIGYNDSIRWDYNGDGKYTNNIDLNGDGIIDPRDWEIGGVKFVNSHGTGAQNGGFCYMMYKCLAETFENGGIWNQAVHILDVDENYQPLMTYKVTLKHDNRQEVKIFAGVSQDTTDIAPAWLMDFPIISYQGGKHYMQGNDTAESLKSLEFGLDITPLLSHLQPGLPAKFFFVVDENDPMDEGEGEISSFSLMDYTSGNEEIVSTETPVTLANNSRTSASLIYFPVFDMVEIISASLPPYSVNEQYSYQLAASGGTPPYSWDPQYQYRVEQATEDFPMVDANQVPFDPASDTIHPIALSFSFPFYGRLYDTLYMHVRGHLQFDHSQIPWPYWQEPELLFRTNRMISPMTGCNFTMTPSDGDGGWYQEDDTSAIFRWKLSIAPNAASTDLNFAVKICRNGNIDFFYGPSTLEGISWIGGISSGNNIDYIDSPVSGLSQVADGHKVSFTYHPFPLQLNFSNTGLLTGTMEDDDYIYDLAFRATDQSGLSDTRTLQFSSGPNLFFTVNGNSRIEYGDTVSLNLEVRNLSQDTIRNATLELVTDDPFIEMPYQSCAPGTLVPGQSVTIPEAFYFIVSRDIPDQSDLLFNASLASQEKTWHKEVVFTANAPDLNLKPVVIEDGDNGRLDPGETAPMMITLQNSGHAAIDGVTAELIPLNTEVSIIGNSFQDYGMIGKGASVTNAFTLRAEDSTPDGLIASFALSVEALPGLQLLDTIEIKIGKTPVLVIDMDPGNHSGPVIFSLLNELDVASDYEYSIPPEINQYQSLFICLGYYFTNHVLTLGEGTKLAEYLDNGGKIYMEGRKTWKEDPGTPIQPKFNIAYDGSVTTFDTITGVDGSFTAGMSFQNDATNPFAFYYLSPVPPAFSILQDNDLHVSCAIAYDAGVYKTIGALFEFSTMTGIPPSTGKDLMVKYLDFFGIYANIVGLEEQQDVAGGWRVYPNPASRQLTLAPSPSLPQLGEGVRVGADGSRRSLVNLSISDLYGREVMIIDKIPSFPYRLDISVLQDGLYVIRMMAADGESGSLKFLKISE